MNVKKFEKGLLTLTFGSAMFREPVREATVDLASLPEETRRSLLADLQNLMKISERIFDGGKYRVSVDGEEILAEETSGHKNLSEIKFLQQLKH